MHKITLIALLAALFPVWSVAQELSNEERYYFTSGGEMLFSFASVDYDGEEQGTIMRWAPVFNPQALYHIDQNRHLGFFAGLSLQNVGFIMDIPDEVNMRKKFRTYNIGVPLGIKLGNLDRSFVYAGANLEFPFNYKEKTFIDGEKRDKLVVWFSDRVQNFQFAGMAGIQFPAGISLKFKYYFTEFFNQDFTTTDNNGDRIQPYEDFQANVFYFGLSFSLFRDKKFIHQERVDKVL